MTDQKQPTPTEEIAMSALLHRATPEPPRSMSVAAILSRAGSNRPKTAYWARSWRPIATAAVLIAAVVATIVTISHHGGPTLAPAATGTPTPTPTTAPTTQRSAANSPSSSASPSPSSAVVTCRATNLVGSAGAAGMVRGSTFVPIRVRNSASTPCAVSGYPIIAVSGHHINTAGQPTSAEEAISISVQHGSLYARADPGAHIITLASGATAAFYIGSGTGPGPGLDTVLITHVTLSIPGIAGPISVTIGAPGLPSTSPAGDPFGLEITALGRP